MKVLIVVNPVSGTKKANKYLTDIVAMFCDAGYECQVQTTTAEVGASALVERYGAGKDLLVCVGGDGTFNEVVSGRMKCGLPAPIGYVPTGSTNDFARGLGLSLNPAKAAEAVLKGSVVNLDAGRFGDRVFTYTASFGMFTKTSYNTSRDLKNTLGHFAYVLQGVKELSDINAYALRIESSEKTVEGSYIYGGICNSRSLGGGLIRFSEQVVDMSDGLFEVFLIKQPKNPAEFMQILFDLNAGNYQGPMFELFSAVRLRIVTEDDVDWTIDGEYQKGSPVVDVENLNSAIPLVM